MFKALPSAALEGLSDHFTTMFARLNIPTSWTVVTAVLIPKVVGAACLSKYRAIACFSAIRKLMGYLMLQMIPQVVFHSFQTGFVPGSHAANGVFAICRAGELSREWNQPIFVVQLDLRKAFDRVKHSAVLNDLRLQGASLQLIAMVARMLDLNKLAVRLGHVNAKVLEMERGLPQGAPESPLLFILVVEMVLRPLLARWTARGRGWRMDDFWLASVSFADDVLLVSSSKGDLEMMVKEAVKAFGEVGLEVGLDKSHWTSYPSMEGNWLQVVDEKVLWEKSVCFVGFMLSLCSRSREAMEHRIAQGEKAFHGWVPIILNRDVPRQLRCKLAASGAICSSLWLCETWCPTKVQQQQLDRWGARVMARAGLTRRKSDEEMGQYWRRMHREGYHLLRSHGGTPNYRRRSCLRGFAGHLARSPLSTRRSALRTRNLAWWRFQQDQHTCKWSGVHPNRFNVWRWETPLTHFYGESLSESVDTNVGWLLRAQARDEWRLASSNFATQVR